MSTTLVPAGTGTGIERLRGAVEGGQTRFEVFIPHERLLQTTREQEAAMKAFAWKLCTQYGWTLQFEEELERYGWTIRGWRRPVVRGRGSA